MTRFLSTLTALLAVGLWAVPDVRADEPKKLDAKPLELQIFERMLEQHKDMTFDQLRAKAVKPRDYAAGLSFDPTKAAHFDTFKTKLGITDEETAILKKTGLVSLDLNRRYSFASAYFQVYSSDLPVFVSTDSIMHALHKSYDDILMDMEMGIFTMTIKDILAKTHAEAGAKYKDGGVPNNVMDVDLYLTVARNLLEGAGSPAVDINYDGKPVWDGTVKVKSNHGQDAAVLELLNEVRDLRLHDPYASDPKSREPIKIYGGERYPDFSQFRPRGHYTKNQTLKNYFRAMMWLGRVDCGFNVLPPADTKGMRVDSDRELRDSITFCEALKASGGVKPLRAMDEIIAFMVGRSDNLTVFMLLDICEKMGAELVVDGTVKNFDKVKDELKTGKHAAQMIRSQLVISSPGNSVKVPPPAVFQVFGQRFIMDSFVLSQVVYDSILFKNAKQRRMMPMGLDAMAALGNDEAINLLEPELKQWNYSANLMASRDFVNAHPPTYWKSNLYVLWLDCLRTLHADMSKEKRFPEAMRTKAWQMKQLQTQLGSWAELRHDTILYAKQSYTARPDCSYPAGYVEPYPEFYARVKFFADEAARLFTAAEFPAPGNPNQEKWVKDAQGRYVKFFKQMSETVGTLEVLAKKELAGEEFTDEQKLFVKKTVDRRGGGSGPPRYDGWYPNLFYDRGECAEWAPVVADVHTDPASRSCLEVAVGDAMLGVIAIDNDGDRMVYVGPLYSYYEFHQPVDKRLTDPEWHEMINKGQLPPRPAWTKDFVAPKRKTATPR
jgi:hypothetical protein